LGAQHENKVKTDNVKAHRGTDRREAQQTNASYTAATNLQQESNTETRTPEQEAEIEVSSTQLVKISDINIGKRFREHPGNIDDLVESIKNNKNRPLYPVIVTKDNLLVDGLRRIEAYKRLNIQNIPVLVNDVPSKEDAEIDANVVRKDYTIEQIAAIKKFRESTEPNLQGQRNDLELPGKFPRSDTKQRREERIAKSIGVYSYKTLQKIDKIVDAAQKTLRSSAS